MGNSYDKICLQIIFAVKYRSAMLDAAWRKDVFGFIGTLISDNGCLPVIINGVEDHVHCMLWLKPKIAISELVKTIKAKSSKYINDCRLTQHRFEWQEGYGVFSYHETMVPAVFHYIKNQELHHKGQNLKQEYIDILNEFKVTYNESYIFQDLI